MLPTASNVTVPAVDATPEDLVRVLVGPAAARALASVEPAALWRLVHGQADTGLPLDELARLRAFRTLAERLAAAPKQFGAPLSGPEDAAAAFRHLAVLEWEELHVAYLAGARRVIAIEQLAVGFSSSVAIEPRRLFERALELRAHALILAHNHPSGDPTPSQEDLDFTGKLVRLAAAINLPVLDHIVVGDGRRAYSIAAKRVVSWLEDLP